MSCRPVMSPAEIVRMLDSMSIGVNPGAKVLGLNLDAIGLATKTLARKRKRTRGAKAPRPAAPSLCYPPGTVVASFTVEGRAVPWSVAHRGRSNPHLVAWKEQVQLAASLAMEGRLPHSGRFELRATFELVWSDHEPDLTNIVKGTEDAIEGIVFVNDKKAVTHNTHKDDDARANRVWIEVVAL